MQMIFRNIENENENEADNLFGVCGPRRLHHLIKATSLGVLRRANVQGGSRESLRA